ncbi:hypothetical protein D9611_000139 [Ephemerocybe angulata]|uniref:Amidohydrolase 3 domain-containing protein n=1 Tax=Ephemerocybe angulata TaxID=980116 RepID=A0A8H5BMY6_9AGAR|nr:hypothetical protein D9611_000139 [Tulosesus angulatus]
MPPHSKVTGASLSSVANVNGQSKRGPTSTSTGSVGTRLKSLVVLSVLAGISGILFRHNPSSYAVCSSNDQAIYTVDSTKPQVQCILISGSRIQSTGFLDDIIKSRSPYTQPFTNFLQGVLRQDLPIHYIPEGSIVVPGLSDSHAHILEYGATQQLPLEGTKSVSETVERVKNFILSNPDILNDKTKIVTGGGWDHTSWPSSVWPTAADLDKDPVIKGRPVVLQSKDCHALWVSSEAMKGSLPFPKEVDGGVVVYDDQGNPTGLLLDNAQELLKQPELTNDDLLRRFLVTVRDAHRHGLTSIHDAGLDPMSLAFFKTQAENGKLPIRIYGMKYFNETAEYFGDKLKPLVSADNRLSVRSVKIFADGALRTGGAALYEPYDDNPSTNGFMRIESSVLYDVIPKFLRDGWQVNVHAIGDRANGIILDVFESSLKGVNVTALRPRLEHAQMMTVADMKRLGKLGVIASVQPTHAISDMWYAQERLGPKRIRSLYAFRSILDNGARITLGSDFPVESMNPLSGFYAAITRLSPTGESPHGPGGWFPEQRLTREEALRGMTIDPAYASFTEGFLGSLEVGKLADFVVLSKDIMTVPASEILSTKVLGTVIEGQVVYGEL